MGTLCFVVLLLSVAGAVNAQEANPPLRFEVASIKVSELSFKSPSSVTNPGPNPGTFTRRHAALSTLIITAYRLRPYEYSGPSWLDTAFFDIVAKVPEGTTATQEQQLVMLQNLLAERFGLKVHREKKEMPAYDLVIAKDGPKFREAVPPPPPKEGAPPPVQPKMPFDADGYPVLPPGGGTVWGPTGKDGIIVGAMREQISMEVMARRLGTLTGRPVKDETGLKGKFDLAMHWATNTVVPGAGAAVSSDDAAADAPASAGPSLFAALQSQLGLKLEPAKGTFDVLVVDHVERMPTEN
jgi:uncharacterized protein (TIGR03435 family)